MFPAASRAVTVMTFEPVCSAMLATLQLVVPEAVPLPPRSFDQVTCVTPMLSDAVPPKLSALVALLWVEPEAGEVIVTVGTVVSATV